MRLYLAILLVVSLFLFPQAKIKDASKLDPSKKEVGDINEEKNSNKTVNVKKTSDDVEKLREKVKKKMIEKSVEKKEENEVKGKEKKEKVKKKEEKVQLKIVDNPATPHGTGFASWSQPKELKLRVKPANFSGPLPFKVLTGKCFDIFANTYKYQVCPFHNVTQREQSTRWNSYAGVLGVWKDWIIVNNTFVAWNMPNGDTCGDKMRQTMVLLVCDQRNEVTEVKEPKTCHYEMKFKTPLACSRRNMAVYPWLSKKLQQQWDDVEQEQFNGDITQQGYKKYLMTIWTAAGFVGQQVSKDGLEIDVFTENSDKEGSMKFADTAACEKAYNKLQDEIINLRQQLSIYQPNATLTNVTQSNTSHSNSTINTTVNAINQTVNVPSSIHINNTQQVHTRTLTKNLQTRPDHGKTTHGGVDIVPSNSVLKNDSKTSESHLGDKMVPQQEEVGERRNGDKQQMEGGEMSRKVRNSENMMVYRN
ncbi:N-acetylglucosamine-1-phosphotransferase subunit gamma-like isoform X4 [Corticium candelabrum]|uniref:N-acetylglucosamine-1-phosphotransferase subunit gamma-like isoform X4 n=1 Tax=Corticium candelabrum TaxID=121492 RepID=UPI002E25FEA7|nr:N-acetylglucosamine-1-phosphotransferase subunit gamma-like isoform X4 [Corticium candelabrum]